MTREEILNMPAGREMDSLIAKFVMKVDSPHDVYKFSTDIADAWEVVKKLELFSKYCFYGSDADELWTVHSWKYGKPHFTGIESRTAPLAICRAALLAVMEAE